MAKRAQETKPGVPYIPFKTLLNFIDRMDSSTVPPVIDTSVLIQMSGSMRSQLMSALRSLRLIDANGHVQQTLKNLVSSYNTETFQKVLEDIISHSYSHVVGDVDLKAGTAKQLSKAFRENGNVDGQMLDKAIRFYLAALKEAGVTVSPHFMFRKPRKPRAKKPPKNDQQEENNDIENEIPTAGRIQWRLPIRDKGQAIISLPDNITSEDWRILKIQLDAFINSTSGETL